MEHWLHVPKNSNDPISKIYGETLGRIEEQGASVAVSIRNMDGEILFEHNPLRRLIPASTQKLAMAAWAMEVLPRNFHWRTRIAITGTIDSTGILHGDIIVYGGWDPSLALAPNKYHVYPWFYLDEWADFIHQLGIKQVDGALIGVGNTLTPRSWEISDLPYRYAPVVSQLGWNNNLVSEEVYQVGDNFQYETIPDPLYWSANPLVDRLKVAENFSPQNDSILIDASPHGEINYKKTHRLPFPALDPRRLMLDGFRQVLDQKGILSPDSIIVTDSYIVHSDDYLVNLYHYSPPMESILKIILYSSDNLWAEMVGITADITSSLNETIFLTDSTMYHGNNKTSSLQLNRTQLQYEQLESGFFRYHPNWESVLDSFTIENKGIRAADHCGMARRNLMTTDVLNEILLSSYRSYGDRWLGLLPRGGTAESTLEHRLTSTGDRIAAKSGSMSGVQCLAGYLLNKNNKPLYTFSIFVNGAADVKPSARYSIDKFLELFNQQIDLSMNQEGDHVFRNG